MCMLLKYWTLKFSVLLINIFIVTQRMYSMYLFSVFFFLGMPDKDSMSSSALCQVSKTCNKVNHTRFCPFFCWRGRNLIAKNVKVFSIQLKIVECECKACGWCIWVQYTNYKNALDIVSFNWKKLLVQVYFEVDCYQSLWYNLVWFLGLCWKGAEDEEEKQHCDKTSG